MHHRYVVRMCLVVGTGKGELDRPEKVTLSMAD